ncbi:hypothetical protein DKX38_002035 [Salix brachista]|uniref:Large ribosomal subunit protein eL14 domain-containing protein n=1 Tax=Salix brachista TaxID=2182728 RepID=A0A5N5NLP3_9ROSI|nr:hypothetical protein DKX38_002035 [Salix brachista]
MPFKRYVEIGRVALVNYGKDYGKLVVIVDVIDQNRALVDSPDMVRSQMNFKRLSLTDIKIEINRVPKKKALIEAMEKADVKTKWENSSWGRRLTVQKRRASLNDFDRFKLMLAKIKVLSVGFSDTAYGRPGGCHRPQARSENALPFSEKVRHLLVNGNHSDRRLIARLADKRTSCLSIKRSSRNGAAFLEAKEPPTHNHDEHLLPG